MPEELAGGAVEAVEPATPTGQVETPTGGAEVDPGPPPGTVESYEAPRWFDQVINETMAGEEPSAPATAREAAKAQPVEGPSFGYPTADQWLDDPSTAQEGFKKGMQSEIKHHMSGLDERLGKLETSTESLLKHLKEQRQAEISKEIYSARAKFNDIYENLNQSKNFLGNEKLRKEVDRMIGTWLHMGLEEARDTGNTEKLRAMRKPEFAGRILRLVEGEMGIPGEPLPIRFAGAHEASGRPSPKDSTPSFSKDELDEMMRVGLKPEQVAAARKRMGKR